MNISTIANIINTALDKGRAVLADIPSNCIICTASRRPGFSSFLTSAKVYSDMNYLKQENDDIVKKFVLNVVDKFKKNMQEDGVCLIAIPPGELEFELVGSNAGGPMTLHKVGDPDKAAANSNFILAWGIIR